MLQFFIFVHLIITIAQLSSAIGASLSNHYQNKSTFRILRGHFQTLKSETRLKGLFIQEKNPYWSGPPLFRILENQSVSLVSNIQNVTLRKVLCVVDGRAVLEGVEIKSQVWECDLSFLSFGGLHSVASYGLLEEGLPELLGEPILFTREATLEDKEQVNPIVEKNSLSSMLTTKLAESEKILRLSTPSSSGSLGVYYTTYLNPLAQLYQNITRVFGWTYTIESILQNSSLSFADSVWRFGPHAASIEWQNYSKICDPMHQEPMIGFYCLYRKRENETSGPIPDCPETSYVLKTHASELSSVGFDFIATDFSNWDKDPRNETTPGSDFYQLRPLEIIAEEFANARLNGQATPQLTVFAQVNLGGDLFHWYLDELFNNETLLNLDLIYRNRNSSRVPGMKKIFIAADLGNVTDLDAIKEITSNGGKNDIIVPLMWFAPNASGEWENSGRLSYFSRCISIHEDSNLIDFSTDSWINLDIPCNHKKTLSSPVGSSWTISTGLSINSVPFGAVRFNGLLLKKQWYDVFADPTPTDFLFAPSWNEFGAKAYNLTTLVGANNSAFFASGANFDDPDRFVLFEDGYGAQRSRSIEPTKEDGGIYYELFASCVRVYRLQTALGIVSNGTGCDIAGEECCIIRENESFVHSWSLDRYTNDTNGNTSILFDSILTSDLLEFTTLKNLGWIEVCVPTLFGRGPTATCVDPTLPFQGNKGIDKASRGPFVLYSNISNPSENIVSLVRCVDSVTGRHSITNSKNDCLLISKDMQFDKVLGYGQVYRDSLFARSVHRCSALESSGGKRYYTTVNTPCLEGDVDEGLLMYSI